MSRYQLACGCFYCWECKSGLLVLKLAVVEVFVVVKEVD